MTRFIIRRDAVSGSDTSLSIFVDHGADSHEIACGMLSMPNGDYASLLRTLSAGANIVAGVEVAMIDAPIRKRWETRKEV